MDSLSVRIAQRVQQIGVIINETKPIITNVIGYPYKQENYRYINYDSVRAIELAELKVDLKEISN
ncbi:hypothetical protein CLU81_0500 [Flavobacterium sp. 9]|uniref:hypothetical protein n=1 Tax=Flavobacterium sp. 9 TaxID=2035198 RepID=UPI000C179352|nr:hypothetical protein [Flavobacterium sp. 9]PIF30099.1 hypothetical protein CLU81_0500 [Flavobacterium sp. 9]